ncbi:hypothetical protein FCM35_KLT10878 [Carex littledalei]|uniref:Uncharacterized protein n=1 Tax=Carex littledalei TaxID=544730 RepID=A0A833QMQ0_9POAL|nr:hypothetical protein FCM35_KLT10878 [Carex littledalei]
MHHTLVCSDCKVLVQAVLQNNFLDLLSWQAAEVVAEGAQLYLKLMGRVTLKHVTRELVAQPHSLANWARITRTECTGTVPADVAEKANLHPDIDRGRFQLADQQ